MNHHRVLKRIFWISRTGLPWRDLRAQFGQWSSVYRQFRHWTLAPLGEQIPEALSKSGQVPAARQMVDSLSVRADQQREAAKAGLRDRALAVREVPYVNEPSPPQEHVSSQEDRAPAGADIRLYRLRSGRAQQPFRAERPLGDPWIRVGHHQAQVQPGG